MSFLQERYRLLKLISQGEFDKIFLAVDESRFPVVRCVVEEFSLQIVGFERRRQLLEEIGKHPQIPAIIAYFQTVKIWDVYSERRNLHFDWT